MKNFYGLSLAIGLLMFTFAATSQAQVGMAKKQEPGPKVGAKVKDFSLTDNKGKKRTLSEFLKKGPVAVVFFRSASW